MIIRFQASLLSFKEVQKRRLKEKGVTGGEPNMRKNAWEWVLPVATLVVQGLILVGVIITWLQTRDMVSDVQELSTLIARMH